MTNNCTFWWPRVSTLCRRYTVAQSLNNFSNLLRTINLLDNSNNYYVAVRQLTWCSKCAGHCASLNCHSSVMRAQSSSDVSVKIVAYIALLAISFVLSILIMGLYFRVCRSKRSSGRPSSQQRTTPQGENTCDPCLSTVAGVAETLRCRRRHSGEIQDNAVAPTERSRLTSTSSHYPLTREEV